VAFIDFSAVDRQSSFGQHYTASSPNGGDSSRGNVLLNQN
jgi:hypothetical protein